LFLGLFRHFISTNTVNGDQIKTVTDTTSKFGMTKDQHLGFEAAA